MKDMLLLSMMIETDRLRLIPCDIPHYEAVMKGGAALSQLLEVQVSEPWTEFPEGILISYDQMKSDPSLYGWFFYFIIHKAENKIIGNGGYKGKPDEQGVVEIGYEIMPDYRGQGYATEMVKGLLNNAFSYPEVNKVIAHTLPDYNASVRVLQKAQLKFNGVLKDFEDEAEVWEWEITRGIYEKYNWLSSYNALN